MRGFGGGDDAAMLHSLKLKVSYNAKTSNSDIIRRHQGPLYQNEENLIHLKQPTISLSSVI